VLEIDPEDADVYNNIGNLFYIQEKYEDACVNYLKALEKNPEDDEILSNLGVALSKIKQTSYAWLAFDEALKTNPKGKQVLQNYIICLLQIKQFEKANIIFNHFRSIISTQEKKEYAKMFKDFKAAFNDKGAVDTMSRRGTAVLRKDSTIHKILEEKKLTRLKTATKNQIIEELKEEDF